MSGARGSGGALQTFAYKHGCERVDDDHEEEGGDDDGDIKEDLDDPLNMEGKYLTDLYISIYFCLYIQSNLAIRNFLAIAKLFTNANLFIN